MSWLSHLITSGQANAAAAAGATQQSAQQPSSGALADVPESVLADAAAWLTFVIQQGQAEQLAAVPIGAADCYYCCCCC